MLLDRVRDLVASTLPSPVDFRLETPPDPRFGDVACNAAMLIAKSLGKNPREVATEIAAQLEMSELIEKVEIAGPGFINIFLAPALSHEVLRDIEKQGATFGSSSIGTGRRALLEFISANPTGPLTVANGRGGFGGDVLARVLRRAGFEVATEYYINDAGNQIVTLGRSVQAAAGKIPPAEDMYQGEYIRELAAAFPTDIIDDAVVTGQHFAARLLETEIRPVVEQMGVSFDRWFSERGLHDAGLVEEYTKRLGEHVYEQDGALWLRTTTFGDDKDRVLRKSDGEWTYFAADIAYHADKFSRADKLIDIWGADHHGYIGRMQAATACLGRAGDLTVLITQLVRLFREGQEVRMSKRAGNFELMRDLIDVVGMDVARWFFVMRDLHTHLNFDLDLATKQSDENPVYYVQYAHARITGILRTAGEKLPGIDATSGDLSLLVAPAELALIRKMDALPGLVAELAETYAVHQLTTYATELATAFHKFYTQCYVVDPAEPALSAARLRLTRAAKEVLRIVLADLIGVSAPERM